MTVWIFSNDRYGFGVEILDACWDLCRRNSWKCDVIFSSKSHRPRPPTSPSPRNVARFVRSWFMYRRHLRAPAKGKPYRPRMIDDVNANAFLEDVDAADIGLVAGFDQIFRSHAIGRFGTLINVHPSLLPFYRGPTPSYWCIRNHERVSGFTVHRVVPKIDAGEVLYQEAVDVVDGMNPEQLDALLSRRSAAALPSLLAQLVRGERPDRVLVDARALYRVPVDYASFPDR